MIKTRKGNVKIKGGASEILADFCCITRGIKESLMQCGHGQDEAVDRLRKAFDRATASEKEILEQIAETIVKLLEEESEEEEENSREEE